MMRVPRPVVVETAGPGTNTYSTRVEIGWSRARIVGPGGGLLVAVIMVVCKGGRRKCVTHRRVSRSRTAPTASKPAGCLVLPAWPPHAPVQTCYYTQLRRPGSARIRARLPNERRNRSARRGRCADHGRASRADILGPARGGQCSQLSASAIGPRPNRRPDAEGRMHCLPM
jgi:hypothetical protein